MLQNVVLARCFTANGYMVMKSAADNCRVPSSLPKSGYELQDFSLAHTLRTSTGVVSRKQNLERLVQVARTSLSVNVK